jgi:septal ring factor EnvC (AmiA/AmiB activator)
VTPRARPAPSAWAISCATSPVPTYLLRTRRKKQESPEVREVLDKLESLQRELSHTEGRLELEEVARSTLEESLKREKERADAERQERIEAQKKIDGLRNELEEVQISWWKKLFR